jgi:hypothetical protein
MALLRKLRLAPACLLAALASAWAAEPSAPSAGIVDLTEHKVAAYLTRLADLHCTESVTQEKLAPNGHVEKTERSKYDYLLMVEGSGDDFEMNETRLPVDGAKAGAKPAATPVSMLVSNGIATALLIFHPYYRDSFNFEPGPEEVVDGRHLIPIRFEHIPGRRSLAALALRGREYPLDLKGTAWVDRQTDDVVKIDAGLLGNMSDIGLRSLRIHVEYKPAAVESGTSAVNLPVVAVVDVTTPRQHWRNTHGFDGYKSFSIDVEQNPNVKLRAENNPGGNNGAAAVPAQTKEKP